MGELIVPPVIRYNYSFTRSFRAFPALNFGALEAAIVIVSPVWGFLPSLAALSLTSNVPKPTNWIFPPFFNSDATTSVKDFNHGVSSSNNLFLNLLRNASWHMHAIYYIYTFCVKLSRLFLLSEDLSCRFLKQKINLISSVFHGLSIHPRTKTLPLHHPAKKSSDDGISSWIPRPRSHPRS